MSKKARVLIVDDHQEMVALLCDQLTDAGYAVEAARSGEEALIRARQRRPDAVITDLRMEALDGFDVLEGVHALDKTIPVFIMTGFGTTESACDALRRGAYHHLTKPFRLAEITLQLERALIERAAAPSALTSKPRPRRPSWPSLPLGSSLYAATTERRPPTLKRGFHSYQYTLRRKQPSKSKATTL